MNAFDGLYIKALQTAVGELQLRVDTLESIIIAMTSGKEFTVRVEKGHLVFKRGSKP